jgi:DNA-binding NarL/FixJ family response regulator
VQVLIVEDDEFKSTQIASFLRSHYNDLTIITKVSYQSGLEEAVDRTPELILLDMNLPNFDPGAYDAGDQTMLFAGRDILKELMRLRVQTKVIVITQFEQFGVGEEVTTLRELSASLAADFPRNFCGTVYYHPAHEDWKSGLRVLIENLLQ